MFAVKCVKLQHTYLDESKSQSNQDEAVEELKQVYYSMGSQPNRWPFGNQDGRRDAGNGSMFYFNSARETQDDDHFNRPSTSNGLRPNSNPFTAPIRPNISSENSSEGNSNDIARNNEQLMDSLGAQNDDNDMSQSILHGVSNSLMMNLPVAGQSSTTDNPSQALFANSFSQPIYPISQSQSNQISTTNETQPYSMFSTTPSTQKRRASAKPSKKRPPARLDAELDNRVAGSGAEAEEGSEHLTPTPKPKAKRGRQKRSKNNLENSVVDQWAFWNSLKNSSQTQNNNDNIYSQTSQNSDQPATTSFNWSMTPVTNKKRKKFPSTTLASESETVYEYEDNTEESVKRRRLIDATIDSVISDALTKANQSVTATVTSETSTAAAANNLHYSSSPKTRSEDTNSSDSFTQECDPQPSTSSALVDLDSGFKLPSPIRDWSFIGVPQSKDEVHVVPQNYVMTTEESPMVEVYRSYVTAFFIHYQAKESSRLLSHVVEAPTSATSLSSIRKPQAVINPPTVFGSTNDQILDNAESGSSGSGQTSDLPNRKGTRRSSKSTRVEYTATSAEEKPSTSKRACIPVASTSSVCTRALEIESSADANNGSSSPFEENESKSNIPWLVTPSATSNNPTPERNVQQLCSAVIKAESSFTTTDMEAPSVAGVSLNDVKVKSEPVDSSSETQRQTQCSLPVSNVNPGSDNPQNSLNVIIKQENNAKASSCSRQPSQNSCESHTTEDSNDSTTASSRTRTPELICLSSSEDDSDIEVIEVPKIPPLEIQLSDDDEENENSQDSQSMLANSVGIQTEMALPVLNLSVVPVKAEPDGTSVQMSPSAVATCSDFTETKREVTSPSPSSPLVLKSENEEVAAVKPIAQILPAPDCITTKSPLKSVPLSERETQLIEPAPVQALQLESVPGPSSSYYRSSPTYDLRSLIDKNNCEFCLMELQDRGIILENCLHAFCHDCAVSTITGVENPSVKCPLECDGHFTQNEVKSLLSPKNFEMFMKRSLIHDPTLVPCFNPKCSAMCELIPFCSSFICNSCDRDNCLKCKAIHEGMDCREFRGYLEASLLNGKSEEQAKADIIVSNKTGWQQLHNIVRKYQIKSGTNQGTSDDVLNTIVSHNGAILNTDHFDCCICLENIAPENGIILIECTHMFCKDCIISLVRSSDHPVVTCPYVTETGNCDSFLRDSEIKAVVPQEIVDRLIARSLSEAEAGNVNAFHCQTPDCSGWIEIDQHGLTKRNKQKTFYCYQCEETNCIKCKAIHGSITCEMFQLSKCKKKSENKSEEVINKELKRGKTMRCPKCHIVCQKISGCLHMICGFCKHKFNWKPKKPKK